MIRFLFRRAFFLILTLLVVSVSIFLISEIAPGNIARNTLGNLTTPQQEAVFNAQNGLDQPLLSRYKRWMLGSADEASQKLGLPVTRIFDASNNRLSWWGVLPNGTLFQNDTKDGENLIRLERQPDGNVTEVALGAEAWQKDAKGFDVFWGIDKDSRAALWVRASQNEAWRTANNSWENSLGQPAQYMPLQKGLLRGDPGISFFTHRPVAETLLPRILNTAYLAIIAFLIVMPLALLLGLVAGLNEGGFVDRFLSITSLVATATPEFASGIFLVLIFANWLGWFPGAVVLTDGVSIFSSPSLLVLPVLTLTLIELGYVLRITRASMVEVMRTNYIRTATLKGLPKWRIVFKHALRNALMAPITIILLHVNYFIGGIVVVETLFGFPGLGRYILEAALFKDVFAIEAAAMVLVLIAVGTQLIADVIYTYINPRIRYA